MAGHGVIGPSSARGRRFRAALDDAFLFSVAGGPTAPGEARRALSAQLDGRASGTALETARLLLSELVTNCVLHAGAGPGRSIEISGAAHERSLRVEVSCAGPAFEHSPAHPEPANPGGRGLYLVEALSEKWGINGLGDRTGVWFQVPLV